MSDAATFDSDPHSRQVRAVAVIYEALVLAPGISSKDAFDICMSVAGEFLAQFPSAAIEALIDDAPAALREIVAHFNERNPEIAAAERAAMS